MPLWSVAPVASRPRLTLVAWRVFDVPLPGREGECTRHLVGYCLEDQQGQVSSNIQSFSPRERAGVTRRGRVYLLLGHPGLDGDAEYVWNQWKQIWKMPDESVRDVTDEVWTLVCTGDAK